MRPYVHCLGVLISLHARSVAQLTNFRAFTENPQDPHHPYLQERLRAREGLRRAYRARQGQGSQRQGPRPPAHQAPQGYYAQDALW